ncbi:hypothetical protein D3C81_558330 [compost metagenome]
MNEPKPGDIYDTSVMVIKVRRGLPTVIAVNGKVYVYQPKDQYQGGGNQNDRRSSH